MSVSSVSGSSAAQLMSAAQKTQTSPLAPDGDTPAQEAAETAATKQAEKRNGGYAPHSSGAVDILA